jgi:hypothetical protein
MNVNENKSKNYATEKVATRISTNELILAMDGWMDGWIIGLNQVHILEKEFTSSVSISVSAPASTSTAHSFILKLSAAVTAS